MGLVYCVDFGSTFTKASLVDLDEGRIRLDVRDELRQLRNRH